MTRKLSPASIASVYGKQQDRYLALIRCFPLRPIKTDAELKAAIEVVDSLIDQETLSQAERDYLDVLSDLIHDFEEETIPMRPVPDSEMLRELLDLREITQSQVSAGTRIAESTLSEVLSDKRKLTRSQVGKVAKFLHVDPGVFQLDE